MACFCAQNTDFVFSKYGHLNWSLKVEIEGIVWNFLNHFNCLFYPHFFSNYKIQCSLTFFSPSYSFPGQDFNRFVRIVFFSILISRYCLQKKSKTAKKLPLLIKTVGKRSYFFSSLFGIFLGKIALKMGILINNSW